jgi:hypothetical protein
MKTDIGRVEVTRRTQNSPISVEKICEEFFGVLEVTFLRNIHQQKNSVYVYTQNLETVDLSELDKIQNRLKADTFSFGYGAKGIFYILGYFDE